MASKKLPILEKLPRGRPETKDSIEVTRKCEEAFNLGLGILSACERYKLSHVTVEKHYKILKDKLFATMDEDFIRDQRLAKMRAIQALEEASNKTDRILHSASDKLGEDTNIWHNTALAAIKLKSDLDQQRYAFDMTPTLDISDESILEQTRTIEAIRITTKTEKK